VLDTTLPTVQGVRILAVSKKQEGQVCDSQYKEGCGYFVENLEETLALVPSARMEEMTRKIMIPLSLYINDS
jgi:hypothetical protein